MYINRAVCLLLSLALGRDVFAVVDEFYAMDTAFSWLTRQRVACTNDLPTYEVSLLRDLGLRHLRERFSWSECNPSRNVWKCDEYVRNAKWLRSTGKVVTSTFHDMPSWVDGYRGIPRDLVAVHDACSVIARTFGDAVETWEVWNEQDSDPFSTAAAWDFAAFQKAAYLGFSDVPDPPRVAVGALCRLHLSAYGKTLFANDVERYFDVFNFHTYACLWEYDQVFAMLNNFREANRIRDRLYYLSEFGCCFSSQGGWKDELGEDLLAEFLPKAWTLQQMLGVGRSYSFVFGPYRGDGSYELSILREDGSYKPVYDVLRRHLAEVGAARLVGELQAPSGIRAFLFECKDGTQTVQHWSISPLETEGSKPGPSRNIDLCLRSFSLAGRTLQTMRHSSYEHGFTGLVPMARPLSRGVAGPPPVGEEEDRRLVVRAEFDPAEAQLGGDRDRMETAVDRLHVRLYVWNLEGREKTGRIDVSGGPLEGLPSELVLAPWSCATVDVTRVMALATNVNLCVTGVFDGKRSSRLSVPIMRLPSGLRRISIGRKPSDWCLNDSATRRTVTGAGEGAVSFDMLWTDERTDRWFYPHPNLNTQSMEGVRYIEFEVSAKSHGTRKDWSHTQVIVPGPDGKSRYLNFEAPSADGSWGLRRVRMPDAFVPSRFSLGGNPGSTNVQFCIRNLTLMKEP